MLDGAKEWRGYMSLPAGRAAAERSHVALDLSVWSIMRGEMASLGIMSAIESMVFVGAARMVAGARARMRDSVLVKIIVATVGVEW